MPRLQICGLYDIAVQAHLRPFYVRTLAEAERGVKDELQQDGQLKKHPEDYELFSFGEFDEEAGEFLIHAKPVRICRVVDLAGPAFGTPVSKGSL